MTDSSPINVALPNTTEAKMEAISNTAKAVLELARAINGVNTKVEIRNNTITNGDGPAINIETED